MLHLRQRRSGRQRTNVLSAGLDQKDQEENNVRGEHSEENLLKTFPPIVLRVDGHSAGNLKWI
jgi:hypothetical protein